MAGDGQSSRRYRKLRGEFLEQCIEDDTACWLCGMSIDYKMPWPDDEAFELDHMYPRSTHPEHAEDPANFRASHRRCNNQRSNKMPVGGLGKLTRQWVK